MTRRRVERSAVWTLVPAVAMLPFTLSALFVFWLPVGLLTGLSFWWVCAGFAASTVLLFVKPFQVLVLTPVLGARRPTPAETATVGELWNEIARTNGLAPDRYVLRVLPSSELNAYACGGHLVVLTTFALSELSADQLRGVLAHELSHHLGSHAVAITITNWLSAPVVVLARVGVFFENVSTAATNSFGQRSAVVGAIGRGSAAVFHGVAWSFTAALRGGDALGNLVGHNSEYDADKRAVRMGFGRQLADALRWVLASEGSHRAVGWRARLGATHPPAWTRVARIEALQRHPARDATAARRR